MSYRDKLYHFLGGLIICLLIGMANPISGLLFAFLVGLGKEILDAECKNNYFDWWDLAATTIGGLTGYAILTMLL